MIEQPQTETIAPAHRAFGGWIILLVIFAMLLPVSIRRSFSAPKGPKEYSQEQLQLNQMVRAKHMMSLLPDSSRQSIPQSANAVDEDELIADMQTQTLAPRLLAISRHEASAPVGKDVLAALRDRKDQKDKALATLYASDKLTPKEAEQVIAALPDQPFMYGLAKVHAREEAGISPSGRDDLVPIWKMALFVVMALILGGGALLGVAVWCGFFAAKAQGTIKPLGLPPDPISKIDADALAWKAAILLGSFIVISQVVGGTGIAKLIGPVASVIPPLAILIILYALNKIPIAGRMVTLGYQGLGRPTVKLLLWGVAGLCAELPLTFSLSYVSSIFFKGLPSPTHPATTLLESGPQLGVIILVTILASVLAPFWEEIMFRGSLFPALSRFIGLVPALLFSSFLFASIHPQGIILWLGLGSIAAVSCLLVTYTRSLVPSIAMHALHNTLIVLLAVAAS